MGAGNVDDIPVGTNVGILDEQVSATCLAIGLPHLLLMLLGILMVTGLH